MDIIDFLISNFLNNDKTTNLKPVFEILKNNSFDLKSLFQKQNLSALIPLIKELSVFMQNKSPTDSVGQYHNLTPIAPFADREIVYSLNRYLSLDS